MSDRLTRINSFIRHASTLAKENPNIDLDSIRWKQILYHELVTLGIDNKETDLKDNKTFDRLLSYFEDRRNIKVHHDPINEYYLELDNKIEEFYNNKDAIKIFIPQKSANLERSARLIFDYLDKMNIAHTSVIARKERNDNIIIEVFNQNDADKIINAFGEHNQIKTGLIEANPFCYSCNNIALAFDRDSSYNAIITHMISTYLRYLRDNNKYDNASALDFINYCNAYYIHHFTNLRDIGEVVADFQLFGKEINNTFNNKAIVNVGNVLHLFLRGLQNDFSLEEYYRSFNIVNNEAFIISTANEVERARTGLEDLKSSNHLGSIDALLLESVDLFKKKYKCDNAVALQIIKNYMESNDPHYITSENDMRNRFIKSGIKEKLKRILNINNCSLEEYYILKERARSRSVLEEAIFETYSKFEKKYKEGLFTYGGKAQAIDALYDFVSTGNPNRFVRDNNARNNLIYTNKDRTLNELSEIKDEDIKNRCSIYVDKVIKERSKEDAKVYRL